MSASFDYFDTLNLLEEEVINEPRPTMAPLTVLMVCCEVFVIVS